jgi:hypothetical protein
LNPGLCKLPALGSMIVHTAGHRSGVVHTSGPGIQGCASSPLPWGLQLLARSALINRGDCIESRPAAANWPGVLHSIELQPGPHGSRVVHSAGPVGADHLRELQPSPHGSQLPTGPQGIAAAGLGLQTFSECLHTADLGLQTFSQCLQTSAYCWP